jgi:hypothetical protein
MLSEFNAWARITRCWANRQGVVTGYSFAAVPAPSWGTTGTVMPLMEALASVLTVTLTFPCTSTLRRVVRRCYKCKGHQSRAERTSHPTTYPIHSPLRRWVLVTRPCPIMGYNRGEATRRRESAAFVWPRSHLTKQGAQSQSNGRLSPDKPPPECDGVGSRGDRTSLAAECAVGVLLLPAVQYADFQDLTRPWLKEGHRSGVVLTVPPPGRGCRTSPPGLIRSPRS